MGDEKDVAAVTTLIQRYADAIDTGDLDGLADPFTSGVLRSPRGAAHGRDEVRAWYDGVILDEDGLPGTHHMVFDIDVTVDGDRARSTSYVAVVQGGMPIVAGRYHDSFVRDDGEWRFDERVIYLDLIGDMSNHFRMARSRDERQTAPTGATEGERHG
jgi:ketosteroid isomerase-like protein